MLRLYGAWMLPKTDVEIATPPFSEILTCGDALQTPLIDSVVLAVIEEVRTSVMLDDAAIYSNPYALIGPGPELVMDPLFTTVAAIYENVPDIV